MKIETKRFELTEVYVEDKNANVVKEAVKSYSEQGFAVTGPNAHYGKDGHEEDRTWYARFTKKTEL